MSETPDIQDAVPSNGEPEAVTQARAVINDNAAAIHRFVRNYVGDIGITVQLAEALTRDLFGRRVTEGGTVDGENTESANLMVTSAITDITGQGFITPPYELQRVVDGAASFEFLVRVARMIDPKVLPPEVIPNQEVVDAMLVVFHYERNTV